jgi:phosphoribosylformimino-5-aminoimidazole carboxamide ribotide isomerase
VSPTDDPTPAKQDPMSGAMARATGSAVSPTGAMALLPAIDLRGGRCVRLLRGDYDQETVYGDDPVAQAMAFIDGGAEALHVVDLDAARSGEPVNRAAIAAICDAVPVPVQVGGGVRSVEAAEALFASGVARVVIGTAALERPEIVARLVARGRAVAIGIDARGDEVATHGWTERTGRTVGEVAVSFAEEGVDGLVVTEIGRDGTMDGPDLPGLTAVLEATADHSTAVVASGGVGSLDDLRALAGLTAGGRHLDGAIVGRALYEGAFDLPAGLVAVRDTVSPPVEPSREDVSREDRSREDRRW